MLIVLLGRPGAGKTTIARALAQRTGAVHVRIDTIEQAIKASHVTTDVGAAGYMVAYRVAADHLRAGLSVIADAVNASNVSRAAWAGVAAECARPHVVVEVVCSDAQEHRRRIEGRVADIAGHVLPSWDAAQAVSMEPLAGRYLSIDTARLSPDAACDRICAYIAQ